MHVLTGTLAAATMLLYGAVALADNPSPSMLDEEARAAVVAAMPDDLRETFKLHDEPRPFRGKMFLDPKGKDIDLSEFKGSLTVLNFWAIWCPPCRKELPYFDEIRAELGGDGVQVVTISLDKGGLAKAGPYLEREELNLDPYTDPKANLAKEMGVLSLPVTAILGPDAREIGRLTGEAQWNSPEAKAWLRQIAALTGADPVEGEDKKGLFRRLISRFW